MAQLELVRRAHVQHGHRASADQLQELLAGNRLQSVELVKIAPDNTVDLGNVALGEPSQCRKNIQYAVVGQCVINESSLTARRQQSRSSQMLQVLGGVRDRQPGAARQNLHRALTLRKLFQQFEAMRMAERFRDRGELGEQRLFWTLA